MPNRFKLIGVANSRYNLCARLDSHIIKLKDQFLESALILIRNENKWYLKMQQKNLIKTSMSFKFCG